MADSNTNVDITPSMGRVKTAAVGAAGGLAGGLAAVVGDRLLGDDLGPIIGTTLIGAVIGGETGRIVAVSGAMDAVWRSALT